MMAGSMQAMLPDTPETADQSVIALGVVHAPVRVVVFTCGPLGIKVANALARLSTVSDIALVHAPWIRKRKQLSGAQRIREAYRIHGPEGLVRRVRHHLVSPFRIPEIVRVPELAAGVIKREFDDLHSQEALKFVNQFGADLGVVAGTYILRETLFDLPRLGSINIHSGRVPDYRGSAPAFWEMYDGQNEVGITIHRVTRALDAGDALLAETFPLDCAPPDDPMGYIERYREDVLAPNALRLVTECIDGIARGRISPVAQPKVGGKTNKLPVYADIRELRQRVAKRRRKVMG